MKNNVTGKSKLLGIDPGLNGGIVIITISGEIVEKHPMPIGENGIDVDAVVGILCSSGTNLAFIENVHAMPGQGVTSMFAFGKGFGILIGILGTLRYDVVYLTPQKWQRIFPRARGKKRDTKKLSISFCKKKWPKEDWTKSRRAKKPHDGMTDAACIAEYGRRAIINGDE